MPDPSFSVQVDPDDLARRQVAAAVSRASGAPGTGRSDRSAPVHHGAHDARMASRERSGRDRSGRAAKGGTRSYAFRRS